MSIGHDKAGPGPCAVCGAIDWVFTRTGPVCRECERRRRDQAAALPILEVAERLGILEPLRRVSQEWVGPCPDCGGDDRFSISEQKNMFFCRNRKAGGPIDLVMLVLGCEFRAALDWMVGGAEVELSAAERAERERKRAEALAERERAEAKYRADAVAQARRIWEQGQEPEGTAVRAYLERRGFSRALLPELPRCLRFHPALPYMVADGPGRWREVFRGPAMLAAVAGGEARAVHRTWIDLDRPNGKARVVDGDREMPAKKVLGSKKGGSIRLHSPQSATVLVMGEGIETTLTARVAADPAFAYWAGVDLGNMAGRGRGRTAEERCLPDLSDDDAFVPPPQIERLVYIMDGDSEPGATRALLERGLRRAMALRRGLTAAIVAAPPGKDLNDVLREGTDV